MILKLIVNLFCGILCCFCDENISSIKTQEIQHPETTVENNMVVVEPIIDEITLKQREMRDTIVLVKTRRGSGSGTIIDRLDIDTKQMFEYRVLTNSHVTHLRFVQYLRGVNSITGKTKIEVVDTGCEVVVFDYQDRNQINHKAQVVAEDTTYDLAILSFVSSKEFVVVKIADQDMLEQVRVFDNVFAIGCQLGQAPSPTVGIISQIFKGTYRDREWTTYGSTAQITPGSSGGGLFKRYDDHYYLIGIPYCLAVTNNGQMIPHLSNAISMKIAIEFIDQNLVTPQ